MDVKKKPWEQKLPLHSWWRPDIPPVAEATVEELSGVEMVGFRRGRMRKGHAAEDIKNADPSTVSRSYLLPKGSLSQLPILSLNPANPGDLLTV
ncbi:hypothetical protein SADUNF_Sadunf07G0049900 [Salix dunnii]|uniref:Uncharacterized protein n=1 Tax=Salix dunnii TaxID=1413687 RepID=A0A835JW71_9ROSI|nr:hypothetical protein SADUNF_Sadunf07G0049900 [Salix dunnii]